MASSIPQFNIKEVNDALIKLLWNSDIDFEGIYCKPDFATGGFLLNEEEVKESLKLGNGKACKLRSKIEFDKKNNVLIVTEIPYGVYTNTICKELEDLINSEDNPGIDNFNDLTGSEPLIKIYLKKNANVDFVLKTLYKNTSLQSYYGINMTMLKDGKYPKIFSWKELLLEHLKHEKEIYIRGYKFDLEKYNKRLNIIEGFFIILTSIDKAIQVIKNSKNTQDAAANLMREFNLNSLQAKAVLEIKLSKLSHMEIEKIENEKKDLISKIKKIEEILNDEDKLKKEIENGLNKTTKELGDERRTQITNIESESDEPLEKKELQINLTNKNNLIVNEISTLYQQNRGGRGSKFELDKDEFIVNSTIVSNTDNIFFFTDIGNSYRVKGSEILLNTSTIESLIPLEINENITAMANINSDNKDKNFIFITKKGILKKTSISEYLSNRKKVKAIKLLDNDKICSVFVEKENIGILTKRRFLLISTAEIKTIGRYTKGVIGIKLDNENDEVMGVTSFNKDTKRFIFLSKDGFIKGISKEDFNIQGRGSKGTIVNKEKENDFLVDVIADNGKNNNLIIVNNKTQIKIDINTLSEVKTKKAKGIISSKHKENVRALKILLE